MKDSGSVRWAKRSGLVDEGEEYFSAVPLPLRFDYDVRDKKRDGPEYHERGQAESGRGRVTMNVALVEGPGGGR